MSKETFSGGSLEWNGIEYYMLATKATVQAMKKSAIYTQGIAKKMIGKGGGKPHIASKPGQPPRRDTGILASSVSYQVNVTGPLVQGLVGPDVAKIKSRKPTTDPEYGLWLEIGSRKMKPRPWLKPSVIKATPKIIEIFKKALGSL